MKLTNERLNKIFDKTDGKCHLCHKPVVFKNHGNFGSRGAWEVEHSKPKSKGGTDHLNNLFCACLKCNREKGNNTNYSVRSKNGVKNAPLSEKNKKKSIVTNTVSYAATGAAIGRFFGPVGMVAGGIIGSLVGSNINPDK